MPHTRNGTVKRTSKAARQAAAAAENTMDRMTDRVREFADETITSAEGGIEAAQELTARYLKDGREAVESMSSLVRSYVRAQPVKSLAIAAGAGIVLSLFLRRR